MIRTTIHSMATLAMAAAVALAEKANEVTFNFMGRMGLVMMVSPDVQTALDAMEDAETTEDAAGVLIDTLVSFNAQHAGDDKALAAKVRELIAKSSNLKTKIVANTPQGLDSAYADQAAFDAAVAKYNGGSAVTLDGNEVKAGDPPSLDYFTHSADGHIDTTGPTD